MSANHFIARLIVPILLGLASAASARPQRIVSINLCADQLLLALADRGQIRALSPNATDASISAAAAAARGLPRTRATAEEVAALGPDLVLAFPGQGAARAGLVGGHAYPILELAPAESEAAIRQQIRAVARAVGHVERGEAMVRRFDAVLARLGRPGRGRVAAYYQRRGYLTGTETLADQLMQRLGLGNLAARIGRGPLSRLSIEQLIDARPDLLILAERAGAVADQGTEMLNHPALRAIPRLHLPPASLACGGPSYLAAAESLARDLGKLR
jgi:iron complex transport system substrate-binding protein